MFPPKEFHSVLTSDLMTSALDHVVILTREIRRWYS